MPNGRSGQFRMSKSEFGAMLRSLPEGASVGSSITGARPVDVQEILRMVANVPDDSIGIEEQDGAAYILHLEAYGSIRPDGAKWILVSSVSPLFEALRREHDTHAQWGGGAS